MTRLIVAVAIMLCLALAACEDDATGPVADGVVRGEVVRIHSDLPLAGASIVIGDQSTTADADGAWQLPHVPQGPATLIVRADSYREHRRSIDVGSWQSFAIALVPVDTLVDIAGEVRHMIDGPIGAGFQLGDREVTSDAAGHWSLTDVPIGPTTAVIDVAPYNRLETPVVVHSDAQHIDLVLTRDVISWVPIEHDSYVFTQDDSLNANRGQAVVLWASRNLGRMALLAIPPIDAIGEGVPIVRATLRVHGYLRPDPGWDQQTRVPLRLDRLSEPFFENAVDFFQRPAFELAGVDTVTVSTSPVNQPLAIDITSVFNNDGAAGVAISVTSGPAGLGILSSEYGNDGSEEATWRPRLELTYRY